MLPISTYSSESTTGTASATVKQAITIIAVAPGLKFGTFAGDSVAVTEVTISPIGGGSRTGTASLLPEDPGNPAVFEVNGEDGLDFQLTLPGDGVVTLIKSGAPDIVLKDWTSSPSGVLAFPSFPFSIKVGATAEVEINQPPGVYTGTFTVEANYD